MNWLIMIYILAVVLCVFVLVAAFREFKKRQDTTYRIVALLSFNLLFWILCELAVQLIYQHDLMFTFHESKYGSILTVTIILWALSYKTVSNQSLSKKVIMFLLVTPVLLMVAIGTNHYHHLFRLSWETNYSSTIHYVKTENGPFFYLTVLFSYVLLLSNFAYLFKAFFREVKFYRQRIFYLICTLSITVLMNALYLVIENRIHFYIDFTPLSLVISAIFLYYTFFVFKPERIKHMARELILNTIHHGTLFIDRKGYIIDSNKKFLNIVGLTSQQVIGKHINEIDEEAFHLIQEKMLSDEAVEAYQVQSFNHMNYYSVNRRDLVDEKKRYIGYTILFTNVTEIQNQITQLQYTQDHDLLTNLYNRIYFESKMEQYDQINYLPIGIILTDLNGLKRINQTQGQEAGDEILIKVGNLLNKYNGTNDFVARLGGDEFAVVLVNTSEVIVDNIVQAIENECREQFNQEIPISVAYTIKTKDEESLKQLVLEAEQNIYLKKAAQSLNERESSLTLLTHLIEVRKVETLDHMKRVATLGKQFAEYIRLSNEDQYRLFLLAHLHDIGMIELPDEIIHKTGTYDANQWEKMKTHALAGYQILNLAPHMKSIAETVLYHHEHWDGSGYPNGLIGESIPYLSRIIHILDAYDAMTHHRSYDKVMTKEDAVLEIDRFSGIQFDPIIAKQFTQMLKNTSFNANLQKPKGSNHEE